MKILHVMAGGDNGGAEMVFVDLCVALKESGVDIHIACRPNATRNPILKDAGIPVHEMSFGGIFDWRTTRSLRRLINTLKPQIVQSWMSRASHKLPKASSCDVDYRVISRLGGYYGLKYYEKTDYFVANTPDIRRYLVEECAVPQDKAFHLNNFAETPQSEAPASRSQENTPKDAFLFLSMARLHSAKGLDTLLHALQSVPQAYLWIAGAGPEEDSLKALSASLGLDERVRFLGWRTDRGALLESCDSVVFPSRFEPFGGTFVQAWAAQKPLVTTASQGPSQYVTHQEDALMVEVDNIEALSAAMLSVIKNPQLRNRLTKNGHAQYLSSFSKEKVVKNYKNLYASIIKDNALLSK